ncbi:DNA repair protein RecO [Rhizomicrobium electricum]|jgi:DNA repair protein RecO (recombination protein O)|uniref:DNA repair protein RecO n=1 Tax=Rhizomicrobium electricum TaxID=480070 RepID=A0ABP3P0S5_9PROT|nr:DNA repair protein RecO [Rhizomicrobium electricum]NIJ47505.1 DNA repair protein RecO (recombination protein O) [Rhizomicrobium electricum]
MEWHDDAIVLSVRQHGESGTILEALTRTHGRHMGLVRGGRKMKPVLQPGNSIRLQWRARLQEHLGNFACELDTARAGALMESREALAGLNAFTSVASATLPERGPLYEPVFVASTILLDAMLEDGLAHWGAIYVRWEAGLLEALGFGLDLSSCAATGETEDLVYVSPKSGRAVSAAAGAPYAGRLFPLPQFLLGSQNEVGADDIAAGLALTGHFLFERVLRPTGKPMPSARLRLDSLAGHQDGESK